MTTWVCLGLGSLALFTRSSWPLMPRCTTRVSPLSRAKRRYLPTRPTDFTVRPSKRVRKCLALGWRRTERPLPTATSFTLRPATSLERSTRRVSTSGSSGTRELPPRRRRRVLLGVLLGTALAPPALDLRDVDLRHVAAVVVGTRTLHHVGGGAVAQADAELLEPALVIEDVGLVGHDADAVTEEAQHQHAGGSPPGVEVDGADHGLERVRQDRGLGPTAGGLLTPAERQHRAHLEFVGDLGQHPGVDDGRAHLGQLPLGEVRVGAVAVLGHDQPEHGVAQELEPLVGRRAVLLAAPAAVAEGLHEERGIPEGMAQAPGQAAHTVSEGVGDRGGRRRGWWRRGCSALVRQSAPSLATT